MGTLAVIAISYWRAYSEPLDDVAIASRQLGVDFRSERIEVNGIELHVVRAGPPEGPPVMLLHGFPEYWWGWRRQAAVLAREGFRVIIPDQRGYNLSDKPADTEAYAREHLVGDILGLADQLELERFALVGHDWGGEVAWRTVLAHPERVERLVIFNAPLPGAWRGLPPAPEDADDAGAYRAFFQTPFIPEIALRLRNWNGLTTALRTTSRPGTFDEAELAHYRGAWSQPGAASGMVNWYRNSAEPPPEDVRIDVPVRIVWGMDDPYFPLELRTLSLAACDRGELVEIEGAGHWLLHEEPERTSQLIVQFLRRAI